MRKHLLAAALVAALGTSGWVMAQDTPQPTATNTAHAKTTISAEQRARLNEKLQLISQTMRAVDQDTRTSNLSAESRRWMLESMYKMSLEQVRMIGVPGTYAATADTISRVQKMSPKALGSQASDLTYTPFNPCRYIDTRNVGGKISGVRSFDLFNSGTSYGGVGACAPITLLGIADENLIGALALNMTIVDTSTAASPGFATARPAGSTNSTALVNWTVSSAGFQLGNAAVVSTDQSSNSDELEISTSGPVHAIVDLFGAFIMPVATALDCVDVIQTVSIADGTRSTGTPACAAGYTVTGGGARTGINQGIVLNASSTFGNGWFASVTNNSGGTVSEDFYARCCRVPGR